MRGLSLVAASRGHSSSWCAGLSLSRPLLLQSTSSRRAGSVAVAHGPSCSAARGIFPDQGSNPCPMHWQADSQPLRHQGSPGHIFLFLLGKYLGMGLLGHRENRSLICKKLSQCFPKWLSHFPAMCESSSCSASMSLFVIIRLNKTLAILIVVYWYLIVVLICSSLRAK